MTLRSAAVLPAPLVAHLRRELGVWPPTEELTLTSSDARELKGWDGRERPVLGVKTPGGTILSLRRDLHRRAAGARTLEEAAGALGGAFAEAVFRWSDSPADLEPLGEWRAADDPVLPEWLRPFGAEALVVVEGGAYVAGVGLKRHDGDVWEISVGTEQAARGRGLARRLVATAARSVIGAGRTPTYLHDPSNHASARVAEAAGFPERGWRMLFFVPASAN